LVDAGLIEDDAGLTHLQVEIVIDERQWEHVEVGIVRA
jgi:hypothetical protein